MQLAALSSSLRYPAQARVGGMTEQQLHSFPRWRDAPAGESRISFAQAGGGKVAPSLVREASAFNVRTQLAAFQLDDGVAAVQYSRLDLPSQSWLDVGADGVLSGFDYLRGRGARKLGGGSTTIHGFFFRHLLAATGDGQSCLAFVSARQQNRLDGFFCRPPGVGLGEAEVPRLLRRITVRGVFG